MNELYYMGIVYKESESSSYFYPSNIAVNMIFKSSISTDHALLKSATGTASSHNKQIDDHSQSIMLIVETNFQVCAYFSSDLHLEMLKLFTDISIRLPGMAFGSITRGKVKTAYSMGIKASQIVDFLVTYASPVVKNHPPVVPTNVVDQLLIWEKELERIKSDEVVLLGAFTCRLEFNNLLYYYR